MDLISLQIGFGILAVVVALAGAVYKRAAVLCVLASFALAMAPVVLVIPFLRDAAEAGDISTILDTADGYVLCSVALGAIVLVLDAIALIRASAQRA